MDDLVGAESLYKKAMFIDRGHIQVTTVSRLLPQLSALLLLLSPHAFMQEPHVSCDHLVPSITDAPELWAPGCSAHRGLRQGRETPSASAQIPAWKF